MSNKQQSDELTSYRLALIEENIEKILNKLESMDSRYPPISDYMETKDRLRMVESETKDIKLKAAALSGGLTVGIFIIERIISKLFN